MIACTVSFYLQVVCSAENKSLCLSRHDQFESLRDSCNFCISLSFFRFRVYGLRALRV